jgi:predicted choloylglycine hydrolase
MKKVISNIIQFRGSHYEFGQKQGELLLNSPLMQNRIALYEKHKKKFVVDLPLVNALLKNFAPGIQEEIHGLRNTLGLTEEQAFLYFGGYYTAYLTSGCSIVRGSNFLIRNYDNDPFSYDGRLVLYEPTDYGFATIGPSMQVTGRMDGMNEKGLVVGYNFVNTKKSLDGFVCNMIGRILLERCTTIYEAIDLLKELPHKHSFNYVLQDATNNGIVVEASPRKIALKEALACTNHFDILKEENRYRMKDSIAREQVITMAHQQTLTFQRAFQLMNGTENGVFAKKYDAWDGTIHTAGYIPTERKVMFALGGNTTPIAIDFANWLNGKNLALSKIKGYLDASTGFINE